MARTEYDCPLAGEKVQVLEERIMLEDKRLGVNRASPELRVCSHVAKGNCPVRHADILESELKGFPYSNAGNCAYLKSLGHHD